MDRVQLHLVYGVDRQRRWRNKATAAANTIFVTFGRLGDGRWYANRTDDAGGAFVFDATEQGERLALRLAYRWMRELGGRWWPTPAAYDGQGEPADGLPWVRRGGEWHLEG